MLNRLIVVPSSDQEFFMTMIYQISRTLHDVWARASQSDTVMSALFCANFFAWMTLFQFTPASSYHFRCNLRTTKPDNLIKMSHVIFWQVSNSPIITTAIFHRVLNRAEKQRCTRGNLLLSQWHCSCTTYFFPSLLARGHTSYEMHLIKLSYPSV